LRNPLQINAGKPGTKHAYYSSEVGKPKTKKPEGKTMSRSYDITIGEQLETIIDSGNVSALLYAIERIMRDKSQHIAENWQDQPLAQSWDKSANEVEKLAAKFHANRVPGIGI